LKNWKNVFIKKTDGRITIWFELMKLGERSTNMARDFNYVGGVK